MQLGVDRNALERLVYNESGGNINVGWDPGHYSQGVAQVSKAVWDEYSHVPWSQAGNPDDYQENITVAAMYLRDQDRRFGSWQLALAAYNEGPGTLDQVLSGRRSLSPVTQNYIAGFSPEGA